MKTKNTGIPTTNKLDKLRYNLYCMKKLDPLCIHKYPRQSGLGNAKYKSEQKITVMFIER